MKAYRTYVTVDDPKQVVLTDVPFEPGQRVEVLVLPQNDAGPETVAELKSLLKETQGVPHLQKLTDEEIAAEIDAYRNGQ